MGNFTVAVAGGLYPNQGVSSLTQYGNGANRRRAAMALSRKGSMELRQLMRTLNGAVAGSTATKTLSRVAHSTTELGGVRTIETETLVGRATLAADTTESNAEILSLSARTYTASPVANGDGNPLGTR